MASPRSVFEGVSGAKLGGAKPDSAFEGVSDETPEREGARSSRARAAITSVGDMAPRDAMASADGLDVGTTAEGCGLTIDDSETPSRESGAADSEPRRNTDDAADESTGAGATADIDSDFRADFLALE